MSAHGFDSSWRSLFLGFTAGAVLVALLLIWLNPSTTISTAAATPPWSGTAMEPTGSVAMPSECYLGAMVPHRSVVVAAQSEGQLEEVLVDVGDAVTTGAVLARLDTRLAHHELAIERAALTAAQAETQRQTLLVDRAEQENTRRQALRDVISQAELDLAESAILEAETRHKASQAEVSRIEARIARLETLLKRSEIRAPFTGTVAARVLDPGATIAPGTPVVHLISQSNQRVRFAVPPFEAKSMGVGTVVRIELDGSEIVLEGRVKQVAPEIDAPSRMIFVQAELEEGASELVAGMAVRVSRSGASEGCLGGR